MPWKCTNMCLLFTATNLSNSFQQHEDLSSKILRASKQHHDHHDHHIMRKHPRQLWVSSSQWPGREICETLFNKLHMAVSIYRGHVSRLNCLFCHWFVVGFHYRIERYKWRQHHQSTTCLYINLLDKNDGTTCLHNVSPLFSTAATSHLQHPHLACWEVPDVILSFKAGQRVRMNLWCSHEFGSFHIPAQLRRLSNLISWYLLDATAPNPSKRWQGL